LTAGFLRTRAQEEFPTLALRTDLTKVTTAESWFHGYRAPQARRTGITMLLAWLPVCRNDQILGLEDKVEGAPLCTTWYLVLPVPYEPHSVSVLVTTVVRNRRQHCVNSSAVVRMHAWECWSQPRRLRACVRRRIACPRSMQYDAAPPFRDKSALQ